jgi:hypothetical protein
MAAKRYEMTKESYNGCAGKDKPIVSIGDNILEEDEVFALINQYTSMDAVSTLSIDPDGTMIIDVTDGSRRTVVTFSVV